MRSQKGITLIALVITIIVMLILVAVSITMAVDGGLFQKAGEATQGTNSAMIAENELGKGAVNVTGVDGDTVTANTVGDVADYYIDKDYE